MPKQILIGFGIFVLIFVSVIISSLIKEKKTEKRNKMLEELAQQFGFRYLEKPDSEFKKFESNELNNCALFRQSGRSNSTWIKNILRGKRHGVVFTVFDFSESRISISSMRDPSWKHESSTYVTMHQTVICATLKKTYPVFSIHPLLQMMGTRLIPFYNNIDVNKTGQPASPVLEQRMEKRVEKLKEKIKNISNTPGFQENQIRVTSTDSGNINTDPELYVDNEVRIDDSGEFAKKYFLYGKDREAVKKLFNSSLPQFLLAHAGEKRHIEVNGQYLIMYRVNTLVEPPTLEQELEFTRQLIQNIP
ncbi:MAG: hypothetical protein GF384_00460 [Elusimicrobia bacterium]|nr:hypothetical protein [Elusimicrobiota bacterium]